MLKFVLKRLLKYGKCWVMSNGVLSMISYGNIVMIYNLIVSFSNMKVSCIMLKILMIFFCLFLVSMVVICIIVMLYVVMILKLKWWYFWKKCWKSISVWLVILFLFIMCLVWWSGKFLKYWMWKFWLVLVMGNELDWKVRVCWGKMVDLMVIYGLLFILFCICFLILLIRIWKLFFCLFYGRWCLVLRCLC